MIELQMVRRMAYRGLLLSPLVVGGLAFWNGTEYAFSGAVGLGMTLLNLWLSARIIGGVAERSPKLLLPAAMATFAFGLLLLTGIALALTATDAVYFPVTGFTLVGSHLGLVLWEAAGAYQKVEPPASVRTKEMTG
ncbi:MAG: hypothetical protein ACRDJI_10455 [Actinomycetota bacterium]